MHAVDPFHNQGIWYVVTSSTRLVQSVATWFVHRRFIRNPVCWFQSWAFFEPFVFPAILHLGPIVVSCLKLSHFVKPPFSGILTRCFFLVCWYLFLFPNLSRENVGCLLSYHHIWLCVLLWCAVGSVGPIHSRALPSVLPTYPTALDP